MSGAYDKKWTARDHALVCEILRETRGDSGEAPAALWEERVAAAGLFVAQFLNWHDGITHGQALAAYRAGCLTVKSAQSAGIVPAGAHWRPARGLAGFVRGPRPLSDTGPS